MSDGFSLKCQTSQLNEDLGLIDYIFSDKTGTLTKNNMVFRSMFANNKRYGSISFKKEAERQDILVEDDDSPSEVIQLNRNNPHSGYPSKDKSWDDFVNDKGRRKIGDPLESSSSRYPKKPESVIEKIASEFAAGRFESRIIFDIITCCHEVIVKMDHSTKLKEYNASSPDELALLQFSNELGYEFEGMDDHTEELLVRSKFDGDQVLRFKRLAAFRFTSDRSRSSVIILNQQNGKYYMLLKGADHVVIDRSPKCEGFSMEELRINLEDFSSVGLRTLVYSYKEISAQAIPGILAEIKSISRIMGHEKERKMAQYASQLEQDLIIVGATAVEDELQDDVRGTLQSLRDAHIKVWMLTGDKLETAINIGYSSGLLTNEDKVLILKSEEDVVNETELKGFFIQLDKAVILCLRRFTKSKPRSVPHGLLMN